MRALKEVVCTVSKRKERGARAVAMLNHISLIMIKIIKQK